MEYIIDIFSGIATLISWVLTPVLVILFLIFIFVKVFPIPIKIAEDKNLSDNEITTIRILTWCGLFAGITWFIALCLALSYKGNTKVL